MKMVWKLVKYTVGSFLFLLFYSIFALLLWVAEDEEEWEEGIHERDQYRHRDL